MSDFQNKKILVKYSDIMERYSISRTTAMKWAREADALYKIGHTARVDVEKLDEYIRRHNGSNGE